MFPTLKKSILNPKDLNKVVNIYEEVLDDIHIRFNKRVKIDEFYKNFISFDRELLKTTDKNLAYILKSLSKDQVLIRN